MSTENLVAVSFSFLIESEALLEDQMIFGAGEGFTQAAMITYIKRDFTRSDQTAGDKRWDRNSACEQDRARVRCTFYFFIFHINSLSFSFVSRKPAFTMKCYAMDLLD